MFHFLSSESSLQRSGQSTKRVRSWDFLEPVKQMIRSVWCLPENLCLINVCKVAEFGETCFYNNLLVIKPLTLIHMFLSCCYLRPKGTEQWCVAKLAFSPLEYKPSPGSWSVSSFPSALPFILSPHIFFKHTGLPRILCLHDVFSSPPPSCLTHTPKRKMLTYC